MMPQTEGVERDAWRHLEPKFAIRAFASRATLRARLILSVFKLRIGVAIALTALGGWAVTPGTALSGWQVFTLTMVVLLASASAGAFNQ